MTTFLLKHPDNNQSIKLHLHPLSEYLADGGRFTDDADDCRAEALAGEFLCAISADGTTLDGFTLGDACDLAGATDRWWDDATGWMLLRDWPAEAPLEARVGGFERLTEEERELLRQDIADNESEAASRLAEMQTEAALAEED